MAVLPPGIRPKPPVPVLQKAHPLAQGLIGAWLYTESGAPTTANVAYTLNDVSGSGNNATSYANGTFAGAGNLLAWSDTPFGRSGLYGFFNGSGFTTVVTVPNAGPVSLDTALKNGEFSVAAWVRYDSLPASNLGYIFNKFYDGTSEPMTLRLNAGSIEISTFAAGIGSASVGVTVGTSFPYWIHVLGTISVKKQRMQIFATTPQVGFLSNSVSITGSVSYSNTNSFAMGEWKTGGREFQGVMDSVLVWNRELTADDYRALYADQYEMFRVPSFSPLFKFTAATSKLRFNSSLNGLGASGPFFHDRIAA